METTTNGTSDFVTFRAPENDPNGPKKWREPVDLPCRTEISQSANTRYLSAQSAVENPAPLGQLVDQLAQRVMHEKWRACALYSLTEIDSQVLAIQLRLSRVHSPTRKIHRTHPQELTDKGRRVLPTYATAR